MKHSLSFNAHSPEALALGSGRVVEVLELIGDDVALLKRQLAGD